MRPEVWIPSILVKQLGDTSMPAILLSGGGDSQNLGPNRITISIQMVSSGFSESLSKVKKRSQRSNWGRHLSIKPCPDTHKLASTIPQTSYTWKHRTHMHKNFTFLIVFRIVYYIQFSFLLSFWVCNCSLVFFYFSWYRNWRFWRTWCGVVECPSVWFLHSSCNQIWTGGCCVCICLSAQHQEEHEKALLSVEFCSHAHTLSFSPTNVWLFF